MKRFIMIFAATILAAWALTSCKGGEEPGYKVEFKTPITQDIYLAGLDADGLIQDLIDTLAVKGQVVNFDLSSFASVDPTAFFIMTPNNQGVYFLAQKGGLVIKEADLGEGLEGTYFKLEGENVSKDNQIIDQFNHRLAKMHATEMQARMEMQDADSARAMELINQSREQMEDLNKAVKSAIAENPGTDAATALLLLNSELYVESISDFEAIEDQLKKGPVYDKVKKMIATKKAIQKGQPFVDIELPTPEGENLKLSDFAGKGRPILLDFWASWCPPCRNANPKFVEIYNKYKDQGFDIYAVSLDRKAEDWKKAIEDDKLTWHHVSKLEPRECPALEAYMIKSIPSNVLIDGDGIIVDHNLMGDDLEVALKLLLKK